MIHRIVIMTFKAEWVDDFLQVFDDSKEMIRNFPGCKGLKLLRDTNNESKLSTFSLWESEEALNNYRHSELFSVTWSNTKILFADRPVAFSNLLERDMGFETF